MDQSILSAALDLAADGLPVFPVRLCERACLRCDVCKSPFPSTHGHKDASADPLTIRKLWENCPGPLIGVPTGASSGVDVLDIDSTKRPQAREWWIKHRKDIPRTRVHQTGSGGLHVLFQHSSDARTGNARLGIGVDVKADGGYIVWWPTHRRVLVDAPLAPWPEWLRAGFRPRPQPHHDHVVVRGRGLDAPFLATLVRMVAGASEGERNSLTFWCACRAGELVAAGKLCATTAIAVIAEAATRSGLPRKEAERTARSGVKTGGGNG